MRQPNENDPIYDREKNSSHYDNNESERKQVHIILRRLKMKDRFRGKLGDDIE